ncbi:uroporphyrinogen-III synthase [Helicobacter enhydrae]|nr:uroporphyrinogen-III synthase [Helicobacter enhydrae]
MSREVIIVGYQAYDFAPSLVVGQIRIYDFCLDFSRFDSLIFTSKNAVLALEKNAKKYPQMDVWRQLPSYVIGRGTQKEVLACGGRVEYIAQNGNMVNPLALSLAKEAYIFMRGGVAVRI